MSRTGTYLKGWLVLALVAVACLSCSGNDRQRQTTTTPRFQAGQYRIEFSRPGDDPASIQELEIIDRIKERIASQGVGEVVSTGSGMGTITILLQVHDQETLKITDAIIQQEYPHARYVMVPDRKDAGDLRGP
jgi:hypothetical protein